MAQLIVVLIICIVIVFAISLSIYKAAKDIQSNEKRKRFFFVCYLISVGIIALGFVWDWYLGPLRYGVYGYTFMAYFVILHGLGMIAYITLALIAVKSLN